MFAQDDGLLIAQFLVGRGRDTRYADASMPRIRYPENLEMLPSSPDSEAD